MQLDVLLVSDFDIIFIFNCAVAGQTARSLIRRGQADSLTSQGEKVLASCVRALRVFAVYPATLPSSDEQALQICH